MEVVWEAFVEILQTTLFLLAQSYGGELGPAILTLSISLRIALIPVSYGAAVRALKNRKLLAELRPQLERLKEAHSKDPRGLAEATLALHKTHNISMFDARALVGGAVQATLGLGMLVVLRRVLTTGVGGFLWIKDLSRPDIFIAGIAAGLVGLTGALSGGASESNLPTTTLLMLPLLTLMFALRMSSGFGLHMAASGAISLAQSVVVRLRHGERRTS